MDVEQKRSGFYLNATGCTLKEFLIYHAPREANPSSKLYAEKKRDDLRNINHHEKTQFD